MNINDVKQDLPSFFELISYLEEEQKFDHLELTPAMSDSAIHSFGWPIGIVLPTEEFKPVFTQDGVKATVDMRSSDEPSFDYWELKANGEFYFINNLFEDRRQQNEKIFMDVRVKRIAESVFRVGKLYKRLGVDENLSVNIKLSYEGLRGRSLSTASPDFFLPFLRKISVNQFDYVITATVSELNDANFLKVKIKDICRSLFILFDGTQIGDSVLDKILEKFLSRAG